MRNAWNISGIVQRYGRFCVSLALFGVFFAIPDQSYAARPPQRSSFHSGHKPYWSCVKGWYDPDQVEADKEAHRKPSDRKRNDDSYPQPQQDPK